MLSSHPQSSLADSHPDRPIVNNLPIYEALARAWNIHVSDKVVNPSTQRGVRRGHGKL